MRSTTLLGLAGLAVTLLASDGRPLTAPDVRQIRGAAARIRLQARRQLGDLRDGGRRQPANPAHQPPKRARLTSSPRYDGQFDWSPDGKLLSLISDRDGADAVWVLRVDGGQATRLSSGVSLDPKWSPRAP